MIEWSPFRAYGPRYKPFCWQNFLTIALILAIAIWFYSRAAHLPVYRWSWNTALSYIVLDTDKGLKPGLLLEGFFTTLRVGFWTFLFSLLLGGIAGLSISQQSFLPRLAYQIVVNLLRNTPPLILLFCVYFLVGNVFPISGMEDALRRAPAWLQTCAGICFASQRQLASMIAAVIALGLYQAAYVAEIFRGSLAGVPQEQWDAALALGFTRGAALRLIILPQALRIALPPLTGQCISTFKESALASLISLPDLTFQSLEIMAVSGMTFEVWICAGVLYLFLGFICACVGAALERRQNRYLF